jgi:hypothetical protein
MTKSTVSKALFSTFGSDFSRATQDQRLLLVEAVAFNLRAWRGVWGDSLCLLQYRGSVLPLAIFVPAHLERNEGLKLLADLNAVIVEGYSVLAASERLRT